MRFREPFFALIAVCRCAVGGDTGFHFFAFGGPATCEEFSRRRWQLEVRKGQMGCHVVDVDVWTNSRRRSHGCRFF